MTKRKESYVTIVIHYHFFIHQLIIYSFKVGDKEWNK